MKLMVVGGGGREHAIIKKLKENKKLDVIEDNNLPSVYQKNEPTYKQKQ